MRSEVVSERRRSEWCRTRRCSWRSGCEFAGDAAGFVSVAGGAGEMDVLARRDGVADMSSKILSVELWLSGSKRDVARFHDDA